MAPLQAEVDKARQAKIDAKLVDLKLPGCGYKADLTGCPGN
jgi:hypothetical protein